MYTAAVIMAAHFRFIRYAIHVNVCHGWLQVGQVPKVSERWSFCNQAHRQPQRGPGKTLSWGPITLSPPPFCMSWDRVEREETWEGCPLIIRLGVWGIVVSSPSGVRVEPRPKMDFMHILGQKKPSGTPFSVFLSDGRAPQTSRGPGKLSPVPPPFSTGLFAIAKSFYLLGALLIAQPRVSKYFNGVV